MSAQAVARATTPEKISVPALSPDPPDTLTFDTDPHPFKSARFACHWSRVRALAAGRGSSRLRPFGFAGCGQFNRFNRFRRPADRRHARRSRRAADGGAAGGRWPGCDLPCHREAAGGRATARPRVRLHRRAAGPRWPTPAGGGRQRHQPPRAGAADRQVGARRSMWPSSTCTCRAWTGWNWRVPSTRPHPGCTLVTLLSGQAPKAAETVKPRRDAQRAACHPLRILLAEDIVVNQSADGRADARDGRA